MTDKERLANEIVDVLERARFFYKGEIYDGVNYTDSIGYLPDLAYDVGRVLGWDSDDSDDLSDYIQIDLCDDVRRIFPFFDTDQTDFNRMYALLVKNYLLRLLATLEEI